MKPTFKVLFSNDTTNIHCISPYHGKNELFRPEMLQATVDEVAGTGVDVHMIQLSSGWVPWYQSKIYPMAEHLAWWKSYFDADPMQTEDMFCRGVNQYLLNGGDLLQLFVDRCRATGQVPFVSYRLNDVHHADRVNIKGNTQGTQSISRFYVEHLGLRLPGANNNRRFEMDWQHKAVRDYQFSLIQEQCENYDIDGFELISKGSQLLPARQDYGARKSRYHGRVRRQCPCTSRPHSPAQPPLVVRTCAGLHPDV